MAEVKSNSLEYIGRVFKGLPAEEQDYLLDTARSLLQVQVGDIYPVESEAVSKRKVEKITVLGSLPAYAGEKI
jgi:radical SAM superfamily enzyme